MSLDTATPAAPGAPTEPYGESSNNRRYAWGVFAMAFALMMSGYLDRQLVVAMFPYLKRAWGLSDAELGGLVSVVSVTVALGTLPVALLVDRWKRARSIALMGSVWSLATVSAAFTGNYAQLLAARGAVGLGEAGYAPAAGALLSAVFPQRMRASVFGTFLSAASLGSVLGAVAGGVIAEKWGWRVAFGVAGIPGMLLALLFLRIREPSAGHVPAEAPAPKLGPRGVLAELLTPRSAVAAYLGGATQIVVMSALYAWLPSYFNRYLRLTTGQAAARTAVVMMAGFLGQIILSIAADRIARRDKRLRLLLPAVLSLVSLVLLVAAFAAMAPGGPQLLVIVVAGFTITAPFGVVGAVCVDVVHPALRASAVSMAALVQNLFGFALGPLVVGAISDAYGLRAALSVIPVFCAFAAGFFLLASRHYGRDLDRVAVSRSACPRSDSVGAVAADKDAAR